MNELNKKMKESVERFCSKNNLHINKELFGAYYYKAVLENNEEIICNTIENRVTTKTLPEFYMKRKTDGKQKRIPKKLW
jgi:hypothetical protein